VPGKNLYLYHHKIAQQDRSAIKNHQPYVLWFTGLSGSGKSTLANEIESILNKDYQCHTYLLDGDNIRSGLNSDLDFSEKGRQENIRRVGELCKLFYDAGLIVITAFISPFRKDRRWVRDLFPKGKFIEIFIQSSIEDCKKRDPKGIYMKVDQGLIKNFSGIDSPYEEPENPEIIVNTSTNNIQQSIEIIFRQFNPQGTR